MAHDPRIVSRDEWLAARLKHLEKEKALTRMRDELNAERRSLPWVKIEKRYEFHGPNGRQTLDDLFGERSQLIVMHFMFGPDWEEGCPSCSFWADNYNGFIVHLGARDVSMVAVSRAPLEKLEQYQQRLGWDFPWVSSLGSDFNSDFNVSFDAEALERGEVYYNYQNGPFPSTEAPGASVFVKNETGDVFHSYSCYARGLDMLNAAYHFIDLVPKGRDEQDLPHTMAWVRRNDSYA